MRERPPPSRADVTADLSGQLPAGFADGSSHRPPPGFPDGSSDDGSSGSGPGSSGFDGRSGFDGPSGVAEPIDGRSDEAPAKPAGRAGRNLPAAIGVGLGLGAVVFASLFVWRPAFLIVVIAAVGIGTWEMVRAVGRERAQAPLLPLLAGGPVLACLAWFRGADGVTLGLLAILVAVFVWRLGDGAQHYQRDVTAAALIAVYVPFLASFAILLARPGDGAFRVVVALLGVVLSDTGGYATGVFFGKHPMAPSVSPKKSWEGFVGSLLCTAAGSAVAVHFLIDGAGWWQGAVFGLAVSGASVLGDLGESMIKRDLDIKDMSDLLPGHGGLMDRLDSILLAAPTAYAVFALLLPPK